MTRGYTALGLMLLIIFPIITFVPELIVYGTLATKANSVVEQTIKEAEMTGGITPEVEEQYKKILKEYGLDDKGFSIKYDRIGKVAHRERFAVELKGSYTFKTFNLLGTGIGNFSLPIVSNDSGISEVWTR